MVSDMENGVNVLGVVKKEFGLLMFLRVFARMGNRRAIGAAIPRVGDLLISGSGVIISFSPRQLGKGCGVNMFAFVWIYLRMGIKKVENEVTEDGVAPMAIARLRLRL